MATMKAELLALKLWQLKHWAFLTGMPSTGTKTDLINALSPGLERPVDRLKDERITSVDMGIRNFACCTVEVPASQDTPSARKAVARPLRVLDWKRMDLTARNCNHNGTQVLHDALAEQNAVPTGTENAVSESAAFTLPHMSRVAHKLTSDLLLSRPGRILIERQFLPRGPTARVTSEWTLRINKLEGMLWACLEALRHERHSGANPFPSVHAVNPDRVAAFWASGRHVSLQPSPDLIRSGRAADKHAGVLKASERKLVKSDKVAIVRSWIAGNDDVAIQFEGNAVPVAEAFAASRRKDAEVMAGGKLDDLADCLLQAVAWVRWEDNRRVLNHMWREMQVSV